MTRSQLHYRLLATSIIAALAAPAYAGRLLTGIPLVWKPTDMKNTATVNLTGITEVKIQLEPFADKRADKTKFGENQEGREPKPVTTSDNVADFARLYLGAMLRHFGLSIVEQGADSTLGGEILDFMVTETNRYNGEVRFKMSLKRNGRTEWSGLTSGGSKRFGRSYKAENYYEAISDALLHAAENLAKDDEFHSALAAR